MAPITVQGELGISIAGGTVTFTITTGELAGRDAAVVAAILRGLAGLLDPAGELGQPCDGRR